MKTNHLLILGGVALAAVWFKQGFKVQTPEQQAEQRRKEVLLNNYKAVEHFQKYGGGF